MRLGFLAFPEMTALDLVGAFDPLTRLGTGGALPDLSWEVVAPEPEVAARSGLVIRAQRVLPDLSTYDLVLVPGGWGTRALLEDREFLDWLETSRSVPLKAAVCTGALLLGAAGFLEGRRATTHPGALEELRPYCREVVRARVVEDDGVWTSGGVTAGIDLGLALCEALAGPEAREAIRTQMDYPRGRGVKGSPDPSSPPGEEGNGEIGPTPPGEEGGG